jgi:hypothetical protein
MFEKAVVIPENTPLEVRLSTDEKGMTTLGVRINGTDECLLAQNVTLPELRCSKSWIKNIGELM